MSDKAYDVNGVESGEMPRGAFFDDNMARVAERELRRIHSIFIEA